MTKVLFASPVRQKEEIFKMHLESLDKLEIPEDVSLSRMFILHNSRNLGKFLNEKDLAFCIETDDNYKTTERTHYWEDNNLRMVTSIKNGIFDFMLRSDFDYVFMVDSDLILQPQTLKVLLEAKKDIISEIFWTKWDTNGILMPNAWDLDHYVFAKDTIEKYQRKGTYLCGGTGACILIHRKVIETGVNYTPIYNLSFWGEDRAFSIRASVMGFELYTNTECPPFHVYRESYIETGKKFLESIKK